MLPTALQKVLECRCVSSRHRANRSRIADLGSGLVRELSGQHCVRWVSRLFFSLLCVECKLDPGMVSVRYRAGGPASHGLLQLGCFVGYLAVDFDLTAGTLAIRVASAYLQHKLQSTELILPGLGVIERLNLPRVAGT